MNERLDVVYTWVDDTFPGYRESLSAHARRPVDLDPARTRDNLDTLKYSLRSLERFVPWVREVYLVTCRPQVPAWLDAATVRVIHHDEFMPAEHLPTFNSFAIVSNLHCIAGLSERFVYVEDDCFFARPIALHDLLSMDRAVVYHAFGGTPPSSQRASSRLSPWNLALAQSNHLLDQRYGASRRTMIRHCPLVIDKGQWSRMWDLWPEAFARTSASRFRALGDVAPNHHYPHFLHHERQAVVVKGLRSGLACPYTCLDNFYPLEFIKLAWLNMLRPKFFCMNDNFGPHPNPRVVALARSWLETRFPRPSRFERAPLLGEARPVLPNSW